MTAEARTETAVAGGVSLVIATRNRPVLLRATLDSVLGGDLLPTEIIVVDQSDPPVGLPLSGSVRGTSVRHIRTPTFGTSRARNIGVRAARHDVIVFTDDDVFVQKDWLRILLQRLRREDRETFVIGRVMVGAPETPGAFATSATRSAEEQLFHGRIHADVLSPLNMAFRREALAGIDSFDERLGPGTAFPAAEDNDLGHRLLEAGRRFRFEPRAVVSHRAWRPREARRSLRYGYGLGQGAFYAKHLGLRDRYMFSRLGSDVARNARATAATLRRGRLPGDELAYLAGLVAGLARWLFEVRLPSAVRPRDTG